MKYLWSAFLTGGLFVMGAVDLALTRKPAVYPAKGQSAQQEAKDDTACYDWARQNTGAYPAVVAAAPPPAQAHGGPRVTGAAGGAPTGALGRTPTSTAA